MFFFDRFTSIHLPTCNPLLAAQKNLSNSDNNLTLVSTPTIFPNKHLRHIFANKTEEVKKTKNLPDRNVSGGVFSDLTPFQSVCFQQTRVVVAFGLTWCCNKVCSTSGVRQLCITVKKEVPEPLSYDRVPVGHAKPVMPTWFGMKGKGFIKANLEETRYAISCL